MCRVLIYRGTSVGLADLLYRPGNSLARQAFAPQMLQMLSLAGFGMLAWDSASHAPETPFSYRTVNQPTFDRNLQDLADKIHATTVLAHVRGVDPGQAASVGEHNLHPFRFRGHRLALAHNGFLAGFSQMRFALLDHIHPQLARHIAGNTDSEWLYALLLSQLTAPEGPQSAETVLAAIEKSIAILREVRRRHGIETHSPMNLFLTDGELVVALRFTLDYGCYDPADPSAIEGRSLDYLGCWYTTGGAYGLHDGEWKMVEAGNGAAGSVLVSSEPLTRDTSTWFEVPEYSALVVSRDGGSCTARVTFIDA